MDEDDIGVGSDEPEVEAPEPSEDPAVESEEEYLTSEEGDEWEDLLEPEPEAPKRPVVKTGTAQPAKEKQDPAKASTEEPAPSDDEAKELKELQDLKPEPAGFKKLRKIAETNIKARREAQATVARLEAELAGTTFRPGTPADDWKPKEYLDTLAKDYPAYYDKLVPTLFNDHVDMIPNEALGKVLTTHVPQLIASAFGEFGIKDWDQLEEFVVAQRGKGGAALPSGTTVEPEKLAEAFGLDSSDPQHKGAIDLIQNLTGRLTAAEKKLGEVDQIKKSSLTQQQQAEADKRVEGLNTQLQTAKQQVLDKIARSIPKGREGLLNRVDAAAQVAIDKDPNAKAARERIEKYYRQGNPALAAGDLKLLTAIMSTEISKAATDIIAPLIENTDLKRRVTQKQTSVRHVPGGTGEGTGSETPKRRSGSLADRARENWARARGEGRVP